MATFHDTNYHCGTSGWVHSEIRKSPNYVYGIWQYKLLITIGAITHRYKKSIQKFKKKKRKNNWKHLRVRACACVCVYISIMQTQEWCVENSTPPYQNFKSNIGSWYGSQDIDPRRQCRVQRSTFIDAFRKIFYKHFTLTLTHLVLTKVLRLARKVLITRIISPITVTS